MIKRSEFCAFDQRSYQALSLNELVTYAVFRLSELGREITFEDIVAACFFMFPQKFVLRGHTEWPDSLTVNRRWVDCRKKGFIEGSAARGFVLTPGGLRIAETVKRKLAIISPLSEGQSPTRAETRTRAGRLLKAIDESDAFRLFKQRGERAAITEFDFRSLLLCTLESSPTTLTRNLMQFRDSAEMYGRKDVLAFLELCESRFRKLLQAGGAGQRGYRGGMMRQKLSG